MDCKSQKTKKQRRGENMDLKTSDSCPPSEVAVKSFFLGPKAENSEWLLKCVERLFADWFTWRREQSGKDGVVISPGDQNLDSFIEQNQFTENLLFSLSQRFEKEIPKFLPRYIGHMFSEISMPAFLGHILTLMHNPNNISPESSKVGVEIENEAINLLKAHMGYSPEGFGHFTSGGTLANFEFLLRARERAALWVSATQREGSDDIMLGAQRGWVSFDVLCEKYPEFKKRDGSCFSGVNFSDFVLLVPQSKHYSWPKGIHFLGMDQSNLWFIDLDKYGRACPRSLRHLIEKAIQERRPIMGVVGIAGTTEMGSIDPIHEFKEVLEDFRSKGFHIWLHIDAAYGGFFRSLIELEESVVSDSTLSALKEMSYSNSMTLDPHKLGYVPYASGVFLAQDPRDYFIRSFTGPYIVSDNKTTGNFTIEGSRSAAGATATWLSLKSLEKVNGYAQVLKRGIQAKKILEEELKKLSCNVVMAPSLDTNIVCFFLKRNFSKLSEINKHTLEVYDSFAKAQEYWISKTTIMSDSFLLFMKEIGDSNQIEMDADHLHLLRATIMNPFFISKESSVDHVSLFSQWVEENSDKWS